MDYLEKIIEDISKIDTSKSKYDEIGPKVGVGDVVGRKANVKITEKQKVYVWIRIYLKDEIDVIEGDVFEMNYTPNNEKIDAIFVTYGKSNLVKNHPDQIISFDPEIDKKVICLMVDEDDINTRKDINFIRSLFKTSRFYEDQIYRRTDFVLTNKRTDTNIDYVDCDF